MFFLLKKSDNKYIYDVAYIVFFENFCQKSEFKNFDTVLILFFKITFKRIIIKKKRHKFYVT